LPLAPCLPSLLLHHRFSIAHHELSIADYIKAFTRLRRSSTNGGAPHKPILLLSVLHWAEEGGLEDERVRITPELVALLNPRHQTSILSFASETIVST
jgi:hypothetical protein